MAELPLPYVPIDPRIWESSRYLIYIAEMEGETEHDCRIALIEFLLFAGRSRPDGDLSDMTPAAIESVCRWDGGRGKLFDALRAGGWLNDKQHIDGWDRHGGKMIAERKRWRENKRKNRALENVHVESGGSPVMSPSKGKGKGKDKTICSSKLSPSIGSAIPIQGGEYQPTEEWFRSLELRLSRQDVERHTLEIRQWCLANPGKQKTMRGLKRFVSAWIKRAKSDTRANSGDVAAWNKGLGL